MGNREDMIAALKRRDMINELKARDAQQAEGDATLAADKKYEETKPNALLASAAGLVQGGLRNWGDEAVGQVARLSGKDPEALKEKTKELFHRSEVDHPNIYGASEFAGKIATLPLTANPLAAAGIAGADAVADTYGKAEDKGSLGTAGHAALSGGLNAATAGVLTKVAPALSEKLAQYGDKGVAWLSKALDKGGNKQLVKALGGTKGQIQALGDKADDLGSMLYENKIIGPTSSSQTIAENLGKQGQALAAETQPIYAASKDSNLRTGELVGQIDEMIGKLKDNPGNAPIIAKLDAYKNDIGNAGKTFFNPNELKDFRQSVAKTVNFNSDAASQLAKKDMYGLLREAEMNQIGKVDPALREANEGLFKNIHLNRLAEDMAENGAARSATNNEIGMNTWNAGDIAAKLKDSSLTTALAMAAREVGRRYGNQNAGLGLKKAAEVIGGTEFAPLFAKAAERGPQAVIALHQALQSNPKYRALTGDE